LHKKNPYIKYDHYRQYAYWIYKKVFEFELKSFSLWMGVRYVRSFSASLILFLFLLFLSRTEVYICSLFWRLDWEKLSNQKSIAMTVRRGTWGFALLSRCCLFVLCGVVMNRILSRGGVVFLILNLRYSVKRNNLQRLCGVVVYHLAVVTKTEEPGLLISTTTRWT